MSEWTPEFRSIASELWLRKFQEYDHDIAHDNSLTQLEKQEILRGHKGDVAGALKVTIEELDEILASTDTTAPRERPAAAPKSSLAGPMNGL